MPDEKLKVRVKYERDAWTAIVEMTRAEWGRFKQLESDDAGRWLEAHYHVEFGPTEDLEAFVLDADGKPTDDDYINGPP